MEKSCTLVIHFDKGTPTIANKIKETLEGNDVSAKIDALKKAIMLLLNGKIISQLFITIEMTLIYQSLLNNLNHPIEYIRGVTLRFLCRLKETEVIEPLIPAVLSNLEHRHPFVRRNAILALLDNALDWIEKLLSTEQDLSAKQNIFLMLFTSAQDREVNYLFTDIDRINDWGELLRMVVLELITSTTIRATANTYCRLLLSQRDNNVKLIVLDRLNELKSSHREIMVDIIMDILRALSSPNLDIRRKTLDIALELITPRNIDEVILALKKEVVKTQGAELEKNGEYRQMLVQAIHSCAIKFPEVASTVVHLLMDFLGDNNVASAIDVVVFVREIIETNPKLRISIVTRLLDTFYQIRAARVCSCALWIIGEYCLSLSEVESGVATIKQCLGELHFYTPAVEREGQDTSKSSQQVNSMTISPRRPAILRDGTYATQTCTLSKLVLRLEEVQSSKAEVNKANAQSLLIMVSMLKLEQSSFLPQPIDNNSYDRIVLRIRLLYNTGNEEIKAKAQISHAQPDDLIDFYHVKSRKGMSQLELEDEVQDDLKRATGEFMKDGDDANKLNRILQLTGFSDPVYAEAYVTVHHYDIVLDVTVINRTKDTLQNLCLELATMGDLKLVERPQNYTLAPESSKQIRANIKVSSTETGVIFGNIVYETSNVLERNVVVLNDIHIDIMDYISPATCADVAFRTMWAEFEWENKVAVNTVIQGEKDFLNHIIKSTNMKCLTPLSALEGECGFLAANLYAKSIFGEDALVNVSVEKQADGKLSGYIRIRSKTQGIALSLGDKITLKQKGGSI
ncbi:hypothetical protein U1Q18_006273 [Sarracenia purpurea var. burkii]